MFLGRWFGIDVKIHWTFWLLLGYIAYAAYSAGQPLAGVLASVGLVVSVFVCVVLHEYGHALTARAFGIGTADITLLPIGGVARLQRMPEKPWQEFLVAIAGPAVNVVIAGMLGALILIADVPARPLLAEPIVNVSFLAQLLAINVVLVVFNMLPVFPMDGGRVFRAVLATTMSYVGATRIAVRVGQALAIALGLAGLFVLHSPMLAIVAVFVFFGAAAEGRAVETRARLRGAPVSAAMTTALYPVEADQPLQEVAQWMMASRQDDFPVVENGRLIGLISRRDLEDAWQQHGPQATARHAMRSDMRPVSFDDDLAAVDARLQEGDQSAAPVVSGDRLVGVISLAGISDFLEFGPWRRRVHRYASSANGFAGASPRGGEIIDAEPI